MRLVSPTLTMLLLLSSAFGQITDSQRLQNDPDVSKLALITRADHSAIFFDSPSGCGYARDGEIRGFGLGRHGQQPDLHFCVEFAVSHDGFHIAYPALARSSVSQIVVRDLKTGAEKMLATTTTAE
jgi:hypothetical protein